jgi:hypothetical protein
MEISMEVPQQTKNELLYDPAMPLLGIYLKEYKTAYNSDTCITIFIAALVTITKL